MIKRLLTGAVVLLLVVLMVMYYNTVIFNYCIALITAISIYELFTCFNYQESKTLMLFSLLYGLASAFIPLYDLKLFILMTFVYISLVFFITIFIYNLIRFQHIIILSFFTIFISAMFMSLSILAKQQYGNWFIILAIGSAFCTDTFAYLTGSLIGKHRLCPNVSPKKSVEGSAGGILFTIAGAFLFADLFTRYTGARVNMTELVIDAFLLSVLAQVGDLTASMIKRTYHVKDFGFIFPGHGGMLDRFDSVLFTSPLVLMFITFQNFIA